MHIKKRDFRFAFVSNSAEIAHSVKREAELFTDNMTISLATMEEALPVAQAQLDGGVEVIIGGGATGRLLRRSLSKPVVTIARTHIDILNALLKAKELGSNIALTSFAEPTEGIDILGKLLNIRIRQLVFDTTAKLKESIHRAIDDGVDCIVGGGICKDMATAYGSRGVVITPGNAVIIQALEEACAIAQAQRTEREHAEQLRSVLETITEAVIGIDSRGKVNILNKKAVSLFGFKAGRVIGRPIRDVLQGTGLTRILQGGQPESDTICRVGGMDMVVNSSPIAIGSQTRGAVATFKLVSRIQDIDRKLREKLYQKGFRAKYDLSCLKGDSRPMQRLRTRSRRFANADAAILIQGESGTGKEIVAQAIHRESGRRNCPFVAVNCSALTETLLESELFGYEEGAFTGALKGGKIGLFEMANSGTIFLDEIADISHGLQVRLLRVLEEKEVMRVGGDKIVPIDVRIISSSHKDLATEVRNGRFRSDLFFRLSVLRLETPSLRERLEDIPRIARELLGRCGADQRLLSDRDAELLKEYTWPGNVRELDALLRRYTLLCDGDTSNTDMLLECLAEIRTYGLENNRHAMVAASGEGAPVRSLKDMAAEYERELIRETLQIFSYNRQEAAKSLGISTNTLWRKLKE